MPHSFRDEEKVMQNSFGKDATRAFFYNECLPAFMSGERLRSGDILVLLGEESLEIPLIDALRIPRKRVHSVERNLQIFTRQARQYLGVSLYFGELVDYLKDILHSNQALGVLNLDIEGTYFAHIDPAMTHVLLFCWRNPETIIATYSSISRDRSTLWEGILSFAVLSWISPSVSAMMLTRMSSMYAKAGFEETLRMALRDALWIRSVLEHAARASVIAGVSPESYFQRILDMREKLWKALVEKRKSPLRLKDLYEIISAFPINHAYLPRIGIRLKAMRHATYKAQPPWSQRCYFTKFQLCDTPMSCENWLEEVCHVFMDAPYIHFDNAGQRHEIREKEGEEAKISWKSILWPDKDIYRMFHPRKSKDSLFVIPQRASVSNTIRVIRERTMEQKRDAKKRKKESS